MEGFEGYVGIRLWEGQWIEDFVLSLLLLLLLAFAFLFRHDYRLFLKMVKDLRQVKPWVSLFEEPAGNNWIFQSFVTFQALFLTSIGLFEIIRAGEFIPVSTIKETGILLSLIFLMVLLYYGLKQLFYAFVGYVFTDKETYGLWKTGYNAVIGIWGVFLYLPVCMLTFSDLPYLIPVFLSLFLYIASRIVIIYKTIQIFSLKKDGWFYFSLYLCGQEIMPLLLVYAGVIYLYNFIELNALWR